MDSPIIQDPKIQKKQSIDRIDDKNEPQDQNKGQVSRRSRKDTDGRDFKCGCGKKYLSYPALYTHIKTKHQGQQPQGTVKYSTAVPPKKSKSKIQQQHLIQIYSLIKRQDIRLLDLLGQKFNGHTSFSSRIKNKILSKDITDAYSSLLKITANPIKLGLQNTLQQHLIVYLIGVGEFVGEKLHEQYQWFARSVRQCYYQIGNQVYNKCFSKKQGGIAYIPKFRVDQVKYFPIISDFYIRFFLPFQYMELNLDLMELILVDFCQWLLKRGSTLIQTILNKQYKLNSPLQFQEDSKNQKQKNKQEEDQRCQRSEIDDIQNQPRQQKRQSSEQQIIKKSSEEEVEVQANEKNQQNISNNNFNNVEQIKNQLNQEVQNVTIVVNNTQNSQKVQEKQVIALISQSIEQISVKPQQIIAQVNKQIQPIVQKNQNQIQQINNEAQIQQEKNE